MSAPLKPMVAAKPAKVSARLLIELQMAEKIVVVMLNAMTPAQKAKVHAQLDAADLSGEGMTRHHERHEAIADAMAALEPESTFAPDEMRVVMAYRTMDSRAKEETMAASVRKAKDYPHRTVPALRLVVGGVA